MKIELEPTSMIESVNGQRTRVWQGTTDTGVPVKAWIATVQPQTNDEAAHAEFARELRAVKSEYRHVGMDLRLFLD